jgi:hypothetical protein
MAAFTYHNLPPCNTVIFENIIIQQCIGTSTSLPLNTLPLKTLVLVKRCVIPSNLTKTLKVFQGLLS